MRMPTAGSRLNLLACAEKRTGKSLGYHRHWRLRAELLSERYGASRRAYRELHPIINPVTGLTSPRA